MGIDRRQHGRTSRLAVKPRAVEGIDSRRLDEFGSRPHEHAKLPAGTEPLQQCARRPTVQQSVQFSGTVGKADDQFMQCVQCHVRIRAMRQFAEQFPLGEFEIPRRAHLAEQFLRTAEILESGMNDVSCAWGGVLVDLHACQSSVFLLRWEIGSRFFEQIAHVLPYSARDRRMVHRVQVHAIDSLSHEVADLLARIDDARLA